ncbi:MAG: OmpA family protein [Campylobacter sp.]|nr:OmpA family protein [Campylobacter sp.]
MKIKNLALSALCFSFLVGCATSKTVSNEAIDNMYANEAVDSSKPLVIFIVDSSESMDKPDLNSNITRIGTTKQDLKDIVALLDMSKTNLGLINYGGQCEVTTAIKSTANTAYFNAKIDNIKPGGYSAVAQAIEAANQVIKESNNPDTHIVLLSDAHDTCGGDPKAAMTKLIEDNPHTKISAFVLGEDPDDFAKNQLKDLLTSDKRYFEIADPREMSNALRDIIPIESLNGNGWDHGVYNFEITFDFDKAVIKPQFYGNVQRLADYMLKTGRAMQIQGHTDSIGTERYNQKLSERRANSVKNKLIELGVDPSKLNAVGHGELVPKVDNSTPENRAINRRVEAHHQ